MTGPDTSARLKALTRWGFVRLTKRDEYLRAGKGQRSAVRCMALQSAARPEADSGSAPRIGLTITRKTGGAVERNRIRRRLRAALKLTPGLDQRPNHDYVVIARRDALEAPFPVLCADLAKVFERVHQSREAGARSSRSKPRNGPASAAGAKR